MSDSDAWFWMGIVVALVILSFILGAPLPVQ